ncbi:hypothetical protein OSSY52_06020 [Tepiditoga spiralis]|uniref:Uncharacterized protein n=1 Tax=Tepiditoga spiralis TaxID=2108365 RepID=A0A7G1G2B2_9BACT|nr:hypothetical protein [Tepiditoga spiralis]BBE30461.1 hypothetical protein OSSY52_06020 [Tepiditoga spiralis]
MKKFFLISILLLLFINVFTSELTKREFDSRIKFSESLKLLFDNKKYEARIKLADAISGEVYIEDIPKFWYYAAKLDLQLGRIDKAKQDLDNILLFSAQNENVNTLKNFIRNIEKFSLTDYSTPIFLDIEKINGNYKSYERFYSPVDAEVLNSEIYILDSTNNRIFKKNDEEQWIKLPKMTYYGMTSDNKLNRIYLGTNKGIYYFNSYAKNNFFNINFKDTAESTTSTNTESKLFKLTNDGSYAVFDVDNAGRICAFDSYKGYLTIFGYDGEILQQKKFDYNVIFTSGVYYQNKIYLLESISKQIYVYDTLTKRVIDKVQLDKNDFYNSITVLPWGPLLIDSYKKGIFIFNLENKKVTPTKIKNFYGKIKLKYGILTLIDSKNSNVYIKRVVSKSKSIYNINIYGLFFDKEKLKVSGKINVSDLNGNNIEYLLKNFYVNDTGGRVNFNYTRNFIKTNVYTYNSIEEFFKTGISQIKTDSFIITKGNIKEKPKAEKIIPLLLSGSSIFYLRDLNDLTDVLNNIIYTTGGIIISPEEENYLNKYLNFAYNPVDMIDYSLTPPIVQGIKQTKVTINMNKQILSDTLYYFTEGVGLGE